MLLFAFSFLCWQERSLMFVKPSKPEEFLVEELLKSLLKGLSGIFKTNAKRFETLSILRLVDDLSICQSETLVECLWNEIFMKYLSFQMCAVENFTDRQTAEIIVL